MDKRYSKIFRDTDKLNDLKKKIKEGYTYASIARHFKVDHTTIYYWVIKLGFRKVEHRKSLDGMNSGRSLPPRPNKIKIPQSKEVKTYRPDLNHPFAEERINPGKNYADYVRAEQERKLKALLNNPKNNPKNKPTPRNGG